VNEQHHDRSESSLWANNGDVRPCRCKLLGHQPPPRLQRAIKRAQVISVVTQAIHTRKTCYDARSSGSRASPVGR